MILISCTLLVLQKSRLNHSPRTWHLRSKTAPKLRKTFKYIKGCISSYKNVESMLTHCFSESGDHPL